MFINSKINCSCTKQNMIKTNQITPFYKYCSLKTALKQKQSKTSGSNGRKVHIYPGWSLMTPFIAKGLKNVYDLEVLKKSSSLETLENCYNLLTFFVRVSAVLCKFYNGDNNIEFIEHVAIEKFIAGYLKITNLLAKFSMKSPQFKLKISGKKTKKKLYQMISFVSMKIMKFLNNKQFSISNIVTKNFFTSIINLSIFAKVNLHHSHVMGEIHGYACSFCSQKLRESI